MNHPTQRSLEQVRCFHLFGVCKCDHNGACDLHTDIARELDAAREEGRQTVMSEAARRILANRAAELDAAREEGRRAGLEEAANAFPSEGAVPGVPVVLFADAIRARIRALATKEPR